MKKCIALILVLLCMATFVSCKQDNGEDLDFGPACFTGEVIDVYDESFLVRIIDSGGCYFFDEEVNVRDANARINYVVGDHVKIQYGGVFLQYDPPQVGAESIVKIDSEGNEIPTKEEPVMVGGELKPSVYVNDTLYTSAHHVASCITLSKECVYLGEVTECVGTGNVPTKNYQANHAPVGAEIYQYYNVIYVLQNGMYCPYAAEEKPATEEKTVVAGCIDYPYYSSVEDLAREAEYIFHGKVIDKAYEWRVISVPAAELYLNPEDVPPVEEELVTVYKVQVLDSYLPTTQNGAIIEVLMMGGETETAIHTFEGTPELYTEDAYVFFLSESSLFENAGWPLNLDQSIYRVEGSLLKGGFPLTFDILEDIQTAILTNEKTDAIHFADYANEELQVYYCDWNNVEDTRIRLSEAQAEELMRLLEPYGSSMTSDVLKSDFMKFYRIQLGTAMTLTIDAERGKYGDQGESYLFAVEKTPGTFIKGTYIGADLLAFLEEQLAEEG